MLARVRFFNTGIILGLCYLAAFSTCLFANEKKSVSTEPQHIVEVGQWHVSVALGLGSRNAVVVGQDDFDFYIAPNIAYYGEQFFFDNGTLGFTLSEQPTYALSLIAEINPNGKYFDSSHLGNIFFPITEGMSSSSDMDQPVESGDQSPDAPTVGDEVVDGGDAGNGDDDGRDVPQDNEDDDTPTSITEELQDRRVSLDAGLQLNYFISELQQFEFKLVQDVSGLHNGLRASGNWSQVLTPWLPADLTGQLNLGFSWLDKNNTNYYYGHQSSYAKLNYELDSVLIPSISVTLKKPLTPKINAVLHFKHQSLPNDLVRSPVTVEADINTAFVGVSYEF